MKYNVKIELKDVQTYSEVVNASAVMTIEDSSNYCLLTMGTKVHSDDVNVGVADLKKKAANQFRKVLHNVVGSLDDSFPRI